MYTPGDKIPKVGRVAIDIHGQSYRLRFTYPAGKNHSFSIARATEEGWVTAIKAAQLINRDIDLGDFDDTYARYSPKHARKLKIAQAEVILEVSLVKIWEQYKQRNCDRIAETTQKKKWEVFDKYLENTPAELHKTNKAIEFVDYLLSKYSRGTLDSLLAGTLYPAINEALERGEIKYNAYPSVKYKNSSKSNIECFESSEIKAIIDSFYSDEFTHHNSHVKHSYYAPMVEFLALTGCRPSEAHALTWEDIKQKNGKTFIRFNKVWTSQVILPHTKTEEIRLFPCNEQLSNLINRIPKIENPNNLIFCSVKQQYIDQGNFRNRYWSKVVKSLVKEGYVEKYLKPYCLRHSFITRMIREGVDIKTVATLSGNSVKTIIENYLAARRDFDLPEL